MSSSCRGGFYHAGPFFNGRGHHPFVLSAFLVEGADTGIVELVDLFHFILCRYLVVGHDPGWGHFGHFHFGWLFFGDGFGQFGFGFLLFEILEFHNGHQFCWRPVLLAIGQQGARYCQQAKQQHGRQGKQDPFLVGLAQFIGAIQFIPSIKEDVQNICG